MPDPPATSATGERLPFHSSRSDLPGIPAATTSQPRVTHSGRFSCLGMTMTILRPRAAPERETTCWNALEMPAAAGYAVLRRPGAHSGPALVSGDRMLLLVPEGTAEELPGLLEWLEWGGVALDLRAHQDITVEGAPPTSEPEPPRGATQHWVRPPGPGHVLTATASLPDLVRLVSAVATECHRARLARDTRPRPQAPALS